MNGIAIGNIREELEGILSSAPAPARAISTINLLAEIADDIATLTIMVDEQALELEDIEARLVKEVQEATDENGKKLYTNEASRKAALVQIKRESQRWMELHESITKVDAEIGRLKRYSSILTHTLSLIEGGRI